LNKALLEALREELVLSERVASDEDGKVLVWIGKGINGEKDKGVNGERAKKKLSVLSAPQPPSPQTPNPERRTSQSPAAERRQLTVMFCDVVGSTALSAQLDPEDLREVVQQYQQTCAEVIQRYDGYIAQCLGDGILVYFGYPTAHEDDAARAVRTGLEIITALQKQVPSPLVGEGQGEGVKNRAKNTLHPRLLPQGEKELQKLQVRIGIHTGPVVVGQMGGGGRHEQLALGETPNIAARLEGLAEPNTIVISAATARLVHHTFRLEALGEHSLKGIAEPMLISYALGNSGRC
jgi:class 3 adenylate cyclase